MESRVIKETRYSISSLDAANPKYSGQVIRSHWGVENNLHWTLDYAFDEDSQRARIDNSAANMAIIRHVSTNLLTSENTARVGAKNKRLKAGWDEEYLIKMIDIMCTALFCRDYQIIGVVTSAYFSLIARISGQLCRKA